MAPVQLENSFRKLRITLPMPMMFSRLWSFYLSLDHLTRLTRARLGILGLAILALSACSAPQADETWSGPTILASVSVEPIPNASAAAKLIRTQHYKIYSTIDDRPDLLDRTAQLMEGAGYLPPVRP